MVLPYLLHEQTEHTSCLVITIKTKIPHQVGKPIISLLMEPFRIEI
jgi:hypothetical protein